MNPNGRPFRALFLSVLLFVPSGVRAETLYNGIELPPAWPPHPPGGVARSMEEAVHLRVRPRVVPIDVGRQLFVDDFLVEESSLRRRFHPATWHASSPVLVPDQPWEQKGQAPMAAPFSDGVFWDETQKLFKMWYMAGYRQATALAVSEDGLQWRKPDWGIVPGTNLVHTGDRDSATVWLDAEAPDPARRYRLIRSHREEVNGAGQWWFEIHVSPDGVHWSDVVARTNDIYPRSTAFYNPFRKVWCFGLRKDHSKLGRCRRYFECADGITDVFKKPEERSWWATADALDLKVPGAETAPQLTNIDCVAYESVMLGLYSVFRGPADPSSGRPELNDVSLGFSRDGFFFERPERTPFLAMSENKGDWNWGNVQSAGAGCVVVGEKLYFYASGRRGGGSGFPDGGAATGLATLRRDGFASLEADATGGSVTTRPVVFSGRFLFVNVNAAKGRFEVEALDADGRPIAPFTRENCLTEAVDSTRSLVRWKGAEHVEALAGKPVRLRFHLRDASLYAFWVSQDARGASGGYLGGGGPGYAGVRDVGGGGTP